MILSHIVAVSRNFVIGKNNGLPWHMPDDLAYFHRITDGHMVIMGRKNYQANGKALVNRENIVITRDRSFKAPDATIVATVEEALKYATSFSPEEVFIVGGGEIYKQTLSMVDRIYITIIETVADGDVYYPKIEISDFRILSSIHKKADHRNPYDHTYYILENNHK